VAAAHSRMWGLKANVLVAVAVVVIAFVAMPAEAKLRKIHRSTSTSSSAESALVMVDVDSDVALAEATDSDIAIFNSVAGAMIRAENRDFWDDITSKLKSHASQPLTEWFHKKKCELCQHIMDNLIDRGCVWGIDKVCEFAAGTACGASGIPFANTMCSKVCSFGFETVLKDKCEEWLKLLMAKYPNNPLDFCKAKQFCGADAAAIACKCFNAKTMCPAK